ncbi:MAG TPA: Rpp14/Pop5 family protein [Nitrososphaera sp.]|nr:Rpp14/Pop5 family protein [Nitrososphaera sp.]
MLNRRAKRRYLLIMHTCEASDAVSAITKRCSELFGSIAAEKAAVRLVKPENGMTTIKCRLEQLDNVLVSIALTDPSVVTLDISGTMKRLQRRLAKI